MSGAVSGLESAPAASKSGRRDLRSSRWHLPEQEQCLQGAMSCCLDSGHALPSCEEDIDLKDLVERGKATCNPRHVPETLRAPKQISGVLPWG